MDTGPVPAAWPRETRKTIEISSVPVTIETLISLTMAPVIVLFMSAKMSSQEKKHLSPSQNADHQYPSEKTPCLHLPTQIFLHLFHIPYGDAESVVTCVDEIIPQSGVPSARQPKTGLKNLFPNPEDTRKTFCLLEKSFFNFFLCHLGDNERRR